MKNLIALSMLAVLIQSSLSFGEEKKDSGFFQPFCSEKENAEKCLTRAMGSANGLIFISYILGIAVNSNLDTKAGSDSACYMLGQLSGLVGVAAEQIDSATHFYQESSEKKDTVLALLEQMSKPLASLANGAEAISDFCMESREKRVSRGGVDSLHGTFHQMELDAGEILKLEKLILPDPAAAAAPEAAPATAAPTAPAVSAPEAAPAPAVTDPALEVAPACT